jgi:5'-3' exonuclease
MIVHLIDGTYELFRHFYGARRFTKGEDKPFGAVTGVLHTVLGLIDSGATHVGVATDHVIESFRNEMWPGYKTSAGVPPVLLGQFPLLEEALQALGVVVWPMVELEADDAMGAAALVAGAEPAVSKVYVCSPDKDLAQCVRGDRIVLLDRRNRSVMDEAGVVAKFGVPPQSIPDFLALVGDSADGYPGLPGWGAKTAAVVLSRFGHLESIPAAASVWELPLRGVDRLAVVFAEQRELAFLFRDLATLRIHAKVIASSDELRWAGPTPDFDAICQRLEAPQLRERALALAANRG